MKSSILVTGGAGYIGSHMVRRLLDQGCNVVIIDDLSTGNELNIHSGATFIKGSVHDKDLLISTIREYNIKFVFHFAAKLIVEESVNDPLGYYEANVVGTLRLLEAMIETSVKRIVFSSTAAVYGQHDVKMISEDAVCIPQNPYGNTKYIAESLIRDVAGAKGQVRYGILRYFNVLGRNSGYVADYQKATHVAANLLEAAAKNETEFHIYGDNYNTKDGTGVRDYIDVRDLVEAHFLLMEHLVSGGSSATFNVGTSEGYSVLELMKVVQAVTGKKIRSSVQPARSGDIAEIRANPEAINKCLKWKPGYSLIESVESMWQQYKSDV